jgi:Skp family chaperone for outer membrane proteins
MRKADPTKKTFVLFTLLFIIIAASSFVAFHKTEEACTGLQRCSQETPATKTGEMIWDVFSRRLISLVSYR